VADYYQDSGRYPASLAELTPVTWFTAAAGGRAPGEWCYQERDSGYRLGYVSGVSHIPMRI
jgi:hypothetical protein